MRFEEANEVLPAEPARTRRGVWARRLLSVLLLLSTLLLTALLDGRRGVRSAAACPCAGAESESAGCAARAGGTLPPAKP